MDNRLLELISPWTVDATDAGHARPAELLRPSMPGDAEGIRAMPPEMPVRHSCKYTASRLPSTSGRCNRTQRNKMQVASQVLQVIWTAQYLLSLMWDLCYKKE